MCAGPMRIFGQNKIGIITTIARPTQARSSPLSDHNWMWIPISQSCRWVRAILLWDLHSIRSGTRSPPHLPDLHVLTCAEMVDRSHTSYTGSGSTHTSYLTCLADRSHTSSTLLLPVIFAVAYDMLRRLCVGPLSASPPLISLASPCCCRCRCSLLPCCCLSSSLSDMTCRAVCAQARSQQQL